MCKQLDMNDLCNKQNTLIKLIGKRSGDGYKKLGVLKLPDMIQVELCKFAYNFKNEQLPLILRQLFTTSSKKHNYDTRNKNAPQSNTHSSTIYNSSFLCKAELNG